MLFFLVSENTFSQSLLKKADRYDLEKVGKRAIRKTRWQLNIPKKQHLKAFCYYQVFFPANFNQEKGSGTVDDFIGLFDLAEDKYWGYVYDDSLNMLTYIMGRRVLPYASTTPDSLYVQYITELSPEYIFGNSDTPNCWMFFCYKDKEITLVFLDYFCEKIVSYPLSELEDWRCLNVLYYYNHPECLECLKIGNASD